MSKSTLDRYLLREFVHATFAALVVLLMVSLSGVIADVLGDIARGRLPANMMLAQLGLQLVRYLPLILPLALMLGLLLGIARLYRDSEMPVLRSVGVGPKRMLRPLLMVTVPMVVLIGALSLWLGPWAHRTSQAMIAAANRSLLIAGLEPGRFTELPRGDGVVYIGAMGKGGATIQRVFVYRQDKDRLDVTTATQGHMTYYNAAERYLTLDNGFRVEGPLEDGRDYRLMRYASNEMKLPAADDAVDKNDPEVLPTTQLLGDPRRQASAQLNFRIAPPLLALAFAFLAVPLAGGGPRQTRYGAVVLGFAIYLISTLLMMMGTDWLSDGKLPSALGLWWLLLPLLAVGLWWYFGEGRLKRPKAAQ